MLFPQEMALEPLIRNPGTHLYDTVAPRVYAVPDFTPLAGVPGSPQLTAEDEKYVSFNKQNLI